MPFFRFAALLGLLALTLIAVAPAAGQTTLGTATVINGGNLRRTPRVEQNNVIGQVCPNDTLTLLEQSGGWYRVRVDTTPQQCDPTRVAAGTEGWVNASLLRINQGRAPAQPPAQSPAPTTAAKPAPTPAPKPTATPVPQPTAAPRTNCDPSYPTVCIPPPPPDLDCGDISYRRFKVLPPDPHRFDGDKDGIGCES